MTTSCRTPPYHRHTTLSTGPKKREYYTIPSEATQKTLIDTSFAYFGNAELPLKYGVRISYVGGLRPEERAIEQTLDLSAYKGITHVSEKGLDELVDEVRELTKQTSGLRSAMEGVSAELSRGILIGNVGLPPASVLSDAEEWREALSAKIREFSGLWQVAYKEERQGGRGLQRLQAYILMMSHQVAFLTANAPTDLPGDVTEKASAMVAQMRRLAMMRLYSDGGASLRAFNEIGDAICNNQAICTRKQKANAKRCWRKRNQASG
jgi:hypothetical protein